MEVAEVGSRGAARQVHGRKAQDPASQARRPHGRHMAAGRNMGLCGAPRGRQHNGRAARAAG
eukprot:5558261-Alexandrium_andersonii.AAC.1